MKIKRKVKIQVQLQLVVTSKVPNILNLDKAWTKNGPDLGPNCLKGLSADDNVMYRCNAKLKNIGLTPTCHILSSAKHSEPR